MVRSSSSMAFAPGSFATTSFTSAFSRSSTTMPRSLMRPSFTSTAMSMPAVRGSAFSAASAFACSARSARSWRDSGVSWNSGALRELHHLVHAGRDRDALGIEGEVIERGVAPLHVEMLGHPVGSRGVVHLDFVACERLVVGAQALHEPLHAHLHGRADAHAGDMGDLMQQMRRAPAAHEHVALFGKIENLFGGEDRDGLLVRAPLFYLAGLALADAADEARLHLHAARRPCRPPRGVRAAGRASPPPPARRPCRGWPSPASSRSRSWHQSTDESGERLPRIMSSPSEISGQKSSRTARAS